MGDDPMIFPFSIKTSKRSSSCNNINNPCPKLCVPDLVKNLNVKVFNLVSGTNETRRRETGKCKCRFNSCVCNNKQRLNDDKCKCECEKLIAYAIKDLFGILAIVSGNVKYCGFSENLDYKNCKCKKRLGDKLVE